MSVYCCKRLFRYRLSPETFGYTLVSIIYLFTYLLIHSMVQDILWKADSDSASQTVACFQYEAL
jgi:hypothetical protein